MLKTIRYIIAAMVLMNVFCPAGFTHESGYEMTIPQVNVPPRIDGRLDDAAWKAVDPVEWGNINTGGVVRDDQFSRSWVVYDAKFFYVAFENLEPNTDKLTMAFPEHDTDVWRDDAAELFIEPNHVGMEPYFQIVINPDNVTFDDENGGARRAWEPHLESATQIYKDRWTLEVKISFQDLGFDETPVDETWGWNFNRHIVSGVSIWTGWATTGASFHTAQRFGNLTFGTKVTAMQPLGKLAWTWGSIKDAQ